MSADIKKVKVSDKPNSKYCALFKRSDNTLHLILDGDDEDNATADMTYNNDMYELVRSKTFEGLFTDGKTKGDSENVKRVKDMMLPETWQPEWDDE